MIKLELIGNVGTDAVVREVNGRKAISFNVATNKKWTDKQGVKHEQTKWVDCVIWRDSANSTEVAKYLCKGQKVWVSGEPDVSGYLNKNGEPVASQRLNVRDIELLGTANNTAANRTEPAPTAENLKAPEAPVFDNFKDTDTGDDLPF